MIKIFLVTDPASCGISEAEVKKLRGDLACASGTPGGAAAALAAGACDAVLAGCCGESLEILRQRDLAAPGAPVVLVSSSPAGETAVELLKQGADDFLAAGRLDRLPAAIDAALEKRARALRERSGRARLDQARKMDALGLMAGVLAHDLNNILGAIEGYATLGMRNLAEADPLKGDLGEIRRAVAKGAGLTRQLLAFSRRQASGKARHAAGKLLEGLREKLRAAAGEKASLELEAPAGLPEISASAELLEQLLVNLVSNARDAMPGGGAIKVKAEPAELAPEKVLSPDRAAAGTTFLKLTVSDSGAGMSPAVLEHLFEPFFTTKGKGKGGGLGLPAAYGIVRQHNGWLEVVTAEGKGSAFSVFLPAAPAASPETPAPAPAAQRPAGVRVLIVEDDEDLRGIAVRALTDAGCVTAQAGTIAGALSLFTRPGLFDVVFSDVILPDGNAADMARRMLAVDPAAALIFTSGHLQDGGAVSFISAGGYPFLLKPYTIDALIETVTRRRRI